ncbi:DNA helicase, partial [Tanacetum coccineum]
FEARYEDTPPLIICKLPHEGVRQEKTRNRFPLKTIMDQNSQSYKGVRFTAEATIFGINMNKDWYYISCHQCNKAAIIRRDDYSFLDHGPQPGPFFRYKFKGYIMDNAATAPLTFFTPAANKVTNRPCTELVEKYKPGDPKKIPPKILAAQGKHDVFQFHLNTLGNLIDLSLDVVYDIQKQYHSTSSSTHEINKVTPSSASAATNQSTEEEENTQKGKEKCIAEEKGKYNTDSL